MKFTPAGPARFRHQRAGLHHLIQSRGVAALLWDPGVGKTATTLDYCSLLALKAAERDEEVRVLILAPLAALDTWVHQAPTFVHPDVSIWAEVLGGTIAERIDQLSARGSGKAGRKHVPREHLATRRSLQLTVRQAGRDAEQVGRRGHAPALNDLPTPRLVLLAMNYDALQSSGKADRMISAVKRLAPHLLVLDESHRVRNSRTATSRTLARFAPHIPRRILLTGTVMPHSPLDVYGQWRILDPDTFSSRLPGGDRKPLSYGAFESRYAEFGGWMGRQVVGYQRLDELQDKISPRAHVARKEDSLDLPPTTDAVVDVHLSPAEETAYNTMKKDLAALLQDGSTVDVPNRLTQMLRLRQITSGYLPDESGTLVQIGDSKIRTVRSIVTETLAGESRVVVFAHFRPEVDRLAQEMKAAGTTVEVITGDTPSKERLSIRQRFRDVEGTPGRIVLIAQARTMSLAVNELVTASHAVYASLSQLREDYEQSRGRLNRQGQARPVTFWFAVAPGTIDAVILEAHRVRGNVETAVLQHITGTRAA